MKKLFLILFMLCLPFNLYSSTGDTLVFLVIDEVFSLIENAYHMTCGLDVQEESNQQRYLKKLLLSIKNIFKIIVGYRKKLFDMLLIHLQRLRV